MPTSRPAQAQDKLRDILAYYSDVEELKDEMETWRDNIPGSLQSSDKYSQVSETADTLGTAASKLEENCDALVAILEDILREPNEMSILDTVIHFTEHKMYKGYSAPRWVRLANPCAALAAAMQLLDEHEDSIKKDLTEEKAQEFLQCRTEVEEALSDLENVDFPSMFG